MHLIEYNLLQEVQPDIMGRRAFAELGIVVVAAKELDVVVALIKVESQIAAALRAFQITAKGAGLLRYGRPPVPGGLQALYLFPSYTVNDGLMDIEEDCPVLFWVFNPALLGNVLGVVYIHNVFERGKIIFALVAAHAIGNGYQPHIMEREKFLGELANLNIVSAQPGEVFHKYRRDVPGLDCGDHFLKAGTLHGSAGDTVIHEKDGIRIALVLGGLLENFLLERDLSRVDYLKQSCIRVNLYVTNNFILKNTIIYFILEKYKFI